MVPASGSGPCLSLKGPGHHTFLSFQMQKLLEWLKQETAGTTPFYCTGDNLGALSWVKQCVGIRYTFFQVLKLEPRAL